MGQVNHALTVEQEFEDQVDINSLKPHPRNPNKGDEKAILASVKSLGFYGAIICQKSSRTIIAGEHRWRAAKRSKSQTIPVVWVECDDVQAIRIMLADNRTADLGRYREEERTALLNTYATRYGNGFLSGTGYIASDLATVSSALDGLTRASAKTTHGAAGIAKTSLTFSCGRVKFQVDAELFTKWLDSLTAEAEENGRSVEQVAAQRMGVDIYEAS